MWVLWRFASGGSGSGDRELTGAGHQDGARRGWIAMVSVVDGLKWCVLRCSVGYEDVCPCKWGTYVGVQEEALR